MLGITTLASPQLLVVYTERGKLNNHIWALRYAIISINFRGLNQHQKFSAF